jgi:hypothetical protein
MILKDFLSISGEHGLFKFIAQGRNAIIVEHLETGKRSTASSSAKVSSLEDISIFTESEDLNLGKVLDKIFEKENGGPAIDAKSPVEKLKSYFAEILPEYDKNRVYASDIKKVILWYNTLQKLNLLVKEEPEKPEKSKKETEKEKKPAAKSKAKGTSKPEAKAKTKTKAKAKATTTGKPGSKSAAPKSKGAAKTK